MKLRNTLTQLFFDVSELPASDDWWEQDPKKYDFFFEAVTDLSRG